METAGPIDTLRLALEQGDSVAAEAVLATDATLYVPGRTGLSGPYRGRAAIMGFLGKLAAVTGGTFSFNTERVISDGCVTVVLGQAACRRLGRSSSTPAVLSVKILAGQVAEIRVFHHDGPGLDGLC